MERLQIVFAGPTGDEVPFFEWGIREAVARRFGIGCDFRSTRELKLGADLGDNMQRNLQRAAHYGAKHAGGTCAYVTGGVLDVRVAAEPTSLPFTLIAVLNGKDLVDASIEPWGDVPIEGAEILTYLGVRLQHLRPASNASQHEREEAAALIGTLVAAMDEAAGALENPGQRPSETEH